MDKELEKLAALLANEGFPNRIVTVHGNQLIVINGHTEDGFDKPIKGFSDAHHFLSNFYAVPLTYGNIEYMTPEHAYQARKAGNTEDHDLIASSITPGKAKRAAKKIERHPGFDDNKVQTMLGVLRAKFKHPALKRQLLATGNSYLEETNNWGDVFWGVCNGEGLNMLGILLMVVRQEIKLQGFNDWWGHIGSGITPAPHIDMERHAENVAREAWIKAKSEA